MGNDQKVDFADLSHANRAKYSLINYIACR